MTAKQQKEIRGIVISPFGDWAPVENIQLEALQKLVGGYITCVDVPGASLVANDNAFDLVFPILNRGVKQLWGYDLIGYVVVTGLPDSEGNTQPISDNTIRLIASLLPITPKTKRIVNKFPRIYTAMMGS